MSNGLSTTLPATGYATVLPRECINGSDADVVDANVDVVNTMYAELLDIEEIATTALRSYYVDFYLTQSLGGGFAQYVFTAPEREEIDAFIRAGLEGMGAAAHLDLFNRSTAAFDSLSEEEAAAYLDGDTDLGGDTDGGGPDGVRLVEELDGEFDTLLETEDIIALNAAWLRSQADLLILDEEELDHHIAERVSRIPNLAERQAEAAEDDLLDAPEFEVIIRELCDVAGHTLLKITMGDPNYEHDGQTSLAWHFTTDQGEFLMLDGEDEAVMIHPDTKEILAAVEFAHEDD